MDEARTEPDESTRLLTNQADEARGSDDRSFPAPRQRLLQKQTLLLMLVLVLLQLHLIFFNIASREAKLRQICYEFDKEHKYNTIGPDGNMVDWVHCYLEEPVVQQLRELLNWEKGISIIVLLLITIPYGKVADFRGKKKVIMLGLVGQLLSCLWTVAVVFFPDIFPLKLVWAGPAFWLVGGGTSLSITLIYLLASENLHEEQRTQLYLCFYGAFILIQVFITGIAYFIVYFSVCIPISVSLVFLGGSLLVLVFVDESTIRVESRQSEDTESTITDHSSEAPILPNGASGRSRLLTLLRSRKVLFTLVVFILPVLAQNALRYLANYAVMISGPGQSIGQILISLSWGDLFKTVLFVLFVPWAIPFVQKRFGVRRSAVDVWIIRGSLLQLTIAGALVTVASTSATRIIASVVLAMGSGLRVSLLSYVTSMAEPELRGRLYGAVQVAETIGQLITWPMVEQGVINGSKYNAWLEWPFLVMSVTGVCVLAVAMVPRVSFNY